jgi:preprotein translocase YajC subunit
MGQFAFVFLIVSSSLCFATPGDAAQEPDPNVTSQPNSDTIVTDVKATEAGAEQVETGSTPLNVSKRKTSFAEEFFSSPLNYFAVLVVCLYVYLMFLKPQGSRNEKKLNLQRLSNLRKNDRVVTSAGIHGIVSGINTDAGTVTLRVDENSNAKLTIDRDSIRSVAS